MLITPLLTLLCAAPLAASPQEQILQEVDVSPLTIKFLPAEMTAEEAEAIGSSLLEMRNAFIDRLALRTPADGVIVTCRLRPNNVSKINHYTNGKDKISIDFPNRGYYRPAVSPNPRTEALGRKIFAQLWMFDGLTSTAGLDPRVLRSLVEYIEFLVKEARNEPHEIPQGPGQLWYQVDQLYGSGTASFVLNAVSGEKVPGHAFADLLRRTTIEALEDESAGTLFDLISSRIPVLSNEDLTPGEPLAPGSTLRTSRAALFNGVPLLGQGGHELTAADRVRDFQAAYSMIVQSYPDRDIAGMPPRLNGHDLWDLYFEFRPRVERARDNVDFFLVMREFLSRFGDRWLTILTPQATPAWRGVSGMSIVDSGGGVFVESVREGSVPANAGITAGLEILSVDGRPAADVWATLQEFNRLTASCCSGQEARSRALNALLTGPEGVDAQLVLRDPQEPPVPEGEPDPYLLTVSLARAAPGATSGADEGPKDGEPSEDTASGGDAQETPAQPPAPTPPKFVEGSIEDGIGVLKVNAFAGPLLVQFQGELKRMMSQEITGLVVDLRGNGQGDPMLALNALSLLLDKTVTLGELAGRNQTEPPGSVLTTPITTRVMPNIQPYLGPATVLVDSWTAGPAELFALGFKRAGRGELVGRPTVGAFNLALEPIQPFQTLTGSGMLLSLTRNAMLDATQSPLLGRGVQPDVRYEATIEQLRSGVDGALALAKETVNTP